MGNVTRLKSRCWRGCVLALPSFRRGLHALAGRHFLYPEGTPLRSLLPPSRRFSLPWNLPLPPLQRETPSPVLTHNTPDTRCGPDVVLTPTNWPTLRTPLAPMSQFNLTRPTWSQHTPHQSRAWVPKTAFPLAALQTAVASYGSLCPTLGVGVLTTLPIEF